jgi:hypothetical protein
MLRGSFGAVTEAIYRPYFTHPESSQYISHSKIHDHTPLNIPRKHHNFSHNNLSCIAFLFALTKIYS